jgi:hypothetical protein
VEVIWIDLADERRIVIHAMRLRSVFHYLLPKEGGSLWQRIPEGLWGGDDALPLDRLWRDRLRAIEFRSELVSHVVDRLVACATVGRGYIVSMMHVGPGALASLASTVSRTHSSDSARAT